MRRLLYVPIVHDKTDMGSFGAALTRQSVALAGERRWALHQRVVRGFWESVEAFLLTLDAMRIAVYQDGLAVGGELAIRIVHEAAGRGSKNYQIVLKLLNRGAKLRKTEDVQLLLQEHQMLRGLGHQEPSQASMTGTPPPTMSGDRLLGQRDGFIARTISDTLKEEELGVLFLGAQHNVEPFLPVDITVVAVKDRQRVSDYLAELFQGRDDAKLEALAGDLTSPVDATV